VIAESRISPFTLANHLLDLYEVGTSSFFSSPKRTMLAQGVWATCHEQADPATLPGKVQALLDQARDEELDMPTIVGAFPFDTTKNAQLSVPLAFQLAGPLQRDVLQAQQLVNHNVYSSVRSVPEPAAHKQNVARALELLQDKQLRKIVLARVLRLESPTTIDIPHLLRSLALHNPASYCFAVNLDAVPSSEDFYTHNAHKRRTFIGASPEMLISRSGMRITSNPLAGSIPRSADRLEDERRAKGLEASAKDQHEHAIVVEAIHEILRPYCRTLYVPSAPSLISTPSMWHLSTRITGVLKDPSITALELALALHPTPAICGTPTPDAKQSILEIEPFDRGFYTGAIGWTDATGDGRWVVSIRCAEVEDTALQLYAGGGIVLGSEPQRELDETTAKFRTMLRALGLGDIEV
jgi:isochorismate synthase